MTEYLIGGLLGLILGAIAGFWLVKARIATALQQRDLDHQQQLASEREKLEQAATDKANKQLEERQREQDKKLSRNEKRLNEQSQQIQEDRQELDRRGDKLKRREENFQNREANVERQAQSLEKREQRLSSLQDDLEQRAEQLVNREQELDSKSQELAERLQSVAELSREEARELLLQQLDEELTAEQSALINKRHTELEARAKEQANELIARAIQRYAAEHTVETTAARVDIANDDMKGRIIGKEGRNIRAFEMATGVDLVIDDTPGIITVSCFDGIRREIARRALIELLEDGRIHPARIEEVLSRIQQDLDHEVLKLGEDAAYATDVSGLHPKLLKLLGKLNYRTSYGQNNLKHTQEVAFLCGAMASDLGLDPKLARRCGLMHDIGKALDHEQEGSHPELGAEALRRYGENEVVQNAALAHHEGHEVTSIYTVLTAAADAISAARPGARRESSERYIKRLEQLEDIACTFDGVMKAYAIQAGRELRVIINGHKLKDDSLSKTARKIARRIEDEVAYPGEVKVTLIRETRQSAVAR